MTTVRSTSTRLPWEGSHYPRMPPSLTPSDESSLSEGPEEIPKDIPSGGISKSEGPGGIQFTANILRYELS